MINFNGNLIHKSEGFITEENRGLQYGDAVFETIRVSNGKVYFWEDHYFRLMASMRILRMEIPMTFSMEYLEKEVIKTIEASNKLSDNYRVKIFINRKTGGKYTPNTNEIDYFISIEKIDSEFYKANDSFYEVELFKDYYIPSSLLSTIKTNSKIINVLGSIFAVENGYDNCLLLNDKKQVVEALNGNIFLVKGTTLITPPLEDGCLRGILRKQLISICLESEEFNLEETPISPFDLQKADELLITNVITGIQAVNKFRKKEFSSVVAKVLLQKLNEKIKQ